MSFDNFLSAGLNLLGGESSDGALGDIVGGFLGGDSGGLLGGIGSSFLGDDIGGVLDNFAGSDGLGSMIGGLMEGDDGIGGAVGSLLGGSNAGDVLGDSGLGSGVSTLLGGESGGWLGGLTTALSGSGGIAGTIEQIAGGNFGGVSGIADQLGEAVGGDLGDVLSTVGAATSGEGGWFGTLQNVIEGSGDSFGSPGGILGTVQELAGDGPAWLQTATSVAEQLGEGNLSEVAASAFGDAVGGSPALQNIADSVAGTLGGAGLVGTALGELGDWGELAEDGLGALGVDLPDVGGAVAVLESLTPESIVEAASESIVEAANEPIAGLGDDLLGDEALDAAATADSVANGVPAPDVDLESPPDGAPNEIGQSDVEFEAEFAELEEDFGDLGLDDDLTAPTDSDPTSSSDDGPAFDEPAPMDDLTKAVEAADELESSVSSRASNERRSCTERADFDRGSHETSSPNRSR